jgi:ABC-type phosphate transport system substrate-binding protein
MRIERSLVLVFLLATAAALQAPLLPYRAGAQALAVPAFRVIVHGSNPHARLDRDFVTNAFLRKASRWHHGEAIRPVDLHGKAVARQKFSTQVLRRSVAAVRIYWQQLIFSGRGLPPPELASDLEVVRYVARNAGAIGYVSGTADVGGLKVVSLD